MTVRVGVVGVGNIGSIHARVYQEHPGVELVAVCDIVKEKADAAAARFGGRAFLQCERNARQWPFARCLQRGD